MGDGLPVVSGEGLGFSVPSSPSGVAVGLDSVVGEGDASDSCLLRLDPNQNAPPITANTKMIAAIIRNFF